MGLRDIGSTLPPGFKFYPSDEELVCYYLRKKVACDRASAGTLVEVDLHTQEPWELPDIAKLSVNEWYFFNFRDRKYATGSRANRATRSGYWKATGKDRTIYDPTIHATVVGMRKTLVFYLGRAPNGAKTNWVMHEFRLESPLAPPMKEDWVLCRVFHKKKGVENNDLVYNNNNSSSYLESSPPHQMPLQHEGYGEMTTTMMMASKSSSHKEFYALGEEGSTSNSAFPDLTPLHYNFMEMEMEEVGSRGIGGAMDQFGLMLDVEFIEDQDLVTNLEEKDQIFF
ncbi:NAC domain-containing protein 100-like [Curcuma longa]|uniref:NAC domain-containing protein 100-like n=1 Tax=Curcuma longa TaxID=136217 RepID=UPI003D9E0227